MQLFQFFRVVLCVLNTYYYLFFGSCMEMLHVSQGWFQLKLVLDFRVSEFFQMNFGHS